MHLTVLLHATGSLGVFPSRAFLPAFVVALLLRFGHGLPYLGDWGLLHAVHSVPIWFTHDYTLIALGVLSLLECAAAKDPDLRQFLDQVDAGVKPAMTFLTALGVTTALDAKTVEAIGQAGFAEGTLAVAAAVGVYFLAGLRRGVYEFLTEVDDDDSLGVQRVLSWLEDFWVVAAAVLLVVFPLLVLVLSGLAFLTLHVLRKRRAAWEEQQKTACPGCGESMFPTAIRCPHCNRPAEAPRAVGFLGQAKLDAAAGPDHALALVEQRRCPSCATHFPDRTPRQECSACGETPFASRDFADAYRNRVDSRLPLTLGVCFFLSLIPVLGAVPAIVYYRMRLAAPYRRYIPSGYGFLARWIAGSACWLVLLLQPIPFLGGLALPVMAWITHATHGKFFLKVLADDAGSVPETDETDDAAASNSVAAN
ncbi:MAG: DUF4126 family protein [Planctomycetales bacterium]